MSKTEREESKRLVTDAKTMAGQDTSGEYMYRLRGLPGNENCQTAEKVLKTRRYWIN